MEIVSALIEQAGERRYLVFDTVANGRELVVTLLVGDQRKQKVSATGLECIQRLAEHHDRRFPEGRVWNVEIRIEAHLHARIEAVFDSAQQGDAIVFWCRNDELYDEVFPLLGFAV